MVSGLVIGNCGCPYRAARFGIERYQLCLTGGVIYFIPIERVRRDLRRAETATRGD
jgi:hypothetical protein